MSDDTYTSIGGRRTAELKVKDSTFLAEAVPVSGVEQAEAEIEGIRRREHGAAHHCTGYRVGADGETFRFNDDGEPGGTAGVPILRRIEAAGLTNTLIVVTRYFGGTKLGTGGLARAYGEAAERVLETCEFVRHVISQPVYVSFEYDDTSAAMHTIDRFGAEVADSTYTERTELMLAVSRSRVEAFVEAFAAALSGRGTLALGDEARKRYREAGSRE